MEYKINVGDKLPKFKAKDPSGHLFTDEDVIGGPLVLYFYPKDDTPGCTKEACSFRDGIDAIKEDGVLVVGVSPDSPLSHQKFIEKYHLNFSLLSDMDLSVCNLFDVIREKVVEGKNSQSFERTTFVCDAEGIIRWIERPVKVEGHYERVLEAVKKIL